jgi:pimeloyl-ACP methyl ester carboxylesterase
VLALIASAALWRVWFLSRPPLIPVGGHRLAARLKGMGDPPVVFEGGFEDAMRLLEPLQDDIAEHTQTLVYDRAGYGRSDPGREPRTALEVAGDLRRLLAVLGVRPPVVLVCYSAGCLFTRVFAHQYPTEVAGIAFIDPATEAAFAGLPGAPPEKNPPAGARREWAALATTLDEVRSAWPLPSVPSVVISAMKPNGQWPIESRRDVDRWLKGQQDFLGKVSAAMGAIGATHVILLKADHESVLTDKDATKALLDLIARLKVQS